MDSSQMITFEDAYASNVYGNDPFATYACDPSTSSLSASDYAQLVAHQEREYYNHASQATSFAAKRSSQRPAPTPLRTNQPSYYSASSSSGASSSASSLLVTPNSISPTDLYSPFALDDYSQSIDSNQHSFFADSQASYLQKQQQQQQPLYPRLADHTISRRASSPNLGKPRKRLSKKPSKLNIATSQASFSHNAYSQASNYPPFPTGMPMPSPNVNIAGLSLSPQDIAFLDRLSPTSSVNMVDFSPPAMLHDGMQMPHSAPAWQTSFEPSSLPTTAMEFDNYSTYPAGGSNYFTAPLPTTAAYAPIDLHNFRDFPLPRPRSAPLLSETTPQPVSYFVSQSSPGPSSRPVKSKPQLKRRVTSVPSPTRKANNSSSQFVNFTCADAGKLLTGVAPSGSSKRKRDEEAARQRSPSQE